MRNCSLTSTKRKASLRPGKKKKTIDWLTCDLGHQPLHFSWPWVEWWGGIHVNLCIISIVTKCRNRSHNGTWQSALLIFKECLDITLELDCAFLLHYLHVIRVCSRSRACTSMQALVIFNNLHMTLFHMLEPLISFQLTQSVTWTNEENTWIPVF